MIILNSSPVQTIHFEGFDFLVKRDDLLNEDFSGNKARKFHYFLNNDFSHIKKIISYGSNQSNAMYSLSVLAKLKGWDFIYYTDHISSFLRENPNGNYKYALQNGMQIIEKPKEQIEQNFQNDTIFIAEGGAVEEAKAGIKILADEIKQYKLINRIKDIKVFLPSGTGTTALFLREFLADEVLTCPCVGDEEYLKKQFFDLQSDENLHPIILKPKRKYHFGKLYKNNYELWQKLKIRTNIEFDLLYDPVGWETLLLHLQNKSINLPVLYIHQGGLRGNETMLQRYKNKFKYII